MARIARIVAPGYPHHITQRGNRRQQVFFNDDDYLAYLDLMAQWSRKYKVDILAWCLMPNHVHLVAVPQSENGLARAIGEAHRRYTRRVNFREKWRGHLWQERFSSFVMDEPHLIAAVRYIEMNPVAAGLVYNPSDYRWSSARAHLAGEDDILVKVAPMLKMIDNWRDFLALSSPEEVDLFHKHERTGRPLAAKTVIDTLEKSMGRALGPKKRGPKKKSVDN